MITSPETKSTISLRMWATEATSWRMRISTHKYTRIKTTPQWNRDALQNEVKQQQYREQLEQALNSETECNELEKLWQGTLEAITETTQRVFGKGKARRIVSVKEICKSICASRSK
ncbi:hypothetical protein WA026_004624 [Henosepilachna vigintioctopunctata]|uniref:Uncharacterized protein n=1 Tax=Henosepilachna vigintioctopunctata TaxID=420089 RepID=A0AAW1V746_9CUCU